MSKKKARINAKGPVDPEVQDRIRTLVNGGQTELSLEKGLGVSKSTIGRIKRGEEVSAAHVAIVRRNLKTFFKKGGKPTGALPKTRKGFYERFSRAQDESRAQTVKDAFECLKNLSFLLGKLE